MYRIWPMSSVIEVGLFLWCEIESMTFFAKSYFWVAPGQHLVPQVLNGKKKKKSFVGHQVPGVDLINVFLSLGNFPCF